MRTKTIDNSSTAFMIASVVQMMLHEVMMSYPVLLHHKYALHAGEPEHIRLISAAACEVDSRLL